MCLKTVLLAVTPICAVAMTGSKITILPTQYYRLFQWKIKGKPSTQNNKIFSNLIILFYLYFMVVITKTKLIDFYEGESRAKESLLRWYHEVVLCDWKDFHEIKQTFNAVDSVGNDRYVFNVAGN